MFHKVTAGNLITAVIYLTCIEKSYNKQLQIIGTDETIEMFSIKS